MNAQVISSNHTVVIDGFQIDLWFNFKESSLDVFMDGLLIMSAPYHPSHKSFNYINIIEVATTLKNTQEKKLASKLRLEELEEKENE
jgi:hypothetical protein